jgi:hypothetical protein
MKRKEWLRVSEFAEPGKSTAETMPFVKVVKNKAYFKRYQVKFRRRRGQLRVRARAGVH